MAKNILQRAIETLPNNGFTRAKKLADLALKTNTDGSGGYTATGYQQAIELLQPYISGGTETQALDAQRLVAGYSNSLTKLTKKERDQNETVSAFKMQEQDAYFTKADGDYGSFRKPGDLVNATSQSLDNIVLGVMNAIDQKNANGDSTDALEGYLKEVSARADAMRQLDTKFQRGELGQGQVLDGFGYYVDVNPLDGSVRGAAVLPVGMLPDKVGSGFTRLDASAKVGSALLPVYAPGNKDQYGDMTVKVGDATWKGNPSNGAIPKQGSSSSNYLFSPGGFDIGDSGKFQVNSTTVAPGSFVQGYVGRDGDGNPVDGVFYRGADQKLYRVDNATFEAFKNDPVLSSKINQYIPRVSPSDAQGLLKQAAPMDASRIGFESKVTTLQNDAATAQAESDRLNHLGFFGKLNEGFKGMSGGKGILETADQAVQGAAVDMVTPGIPAVTKFFANRINRQSTPNNAPTGGSGNDIIEAGKSFFRGAANKIGSFFGGR